MAELENWQPVFIEALAQRPNVSRAARAAGISRRRVYQVREADPEFAAEWDDAIAGSLDELEEIAFGRAKDVSDTLMIFLLKSHRKETYGEKPLGQQPGQDALTKFLEEARRGENSG
jgi:hypothetical protein